RAGGAQDPGRRPSTGCRAARSLACRPAQRAHARSVGSHRDHARMDGYPVLAGRRLLELHDVRTLAVVRWGRSRPEEVPARLLPHARWHTRVSAAHASTGFGLDRLVQLASLPPAALAVQGQRSQGGPPHSVALVRISDRLPAERRDLVVARDLQLHELDEWKTRERPGGQVSGLGVWPAAPWLGPRNLSRLGVLGWAGDNLHVDHDGLRLRSDRSRLGRLEIGWGRLRWTPAVEQDTQGPRAHVVGRSTKLPHEPVGGTKFGVSFDGPAQRLRAGPDGLRYRVVARSVRDQA